MALIAVPALLRQQGIHVDPLGSVLYPTVDWVFNAILWLAGVRDAGI